MDADAARVVLTASGPAHYRYVHTDHLGAPVAVTNGTGQVQWRATYDPFGAAAPLNDVDGDGTPLHLNLRFPGQYADAEAGLHYNYFRNFDPELGRYLESDPVGLGGGPNPFAYVGANPVGQVDPFGLDFESCSALDNNEPDEHIHALKVSEDWRQNIDVSCSDGECFVDIKFQAYSDQLTDETFDRALREIETWWSGTFEHDGITYHLATDAIESNSPGDVNFEITFDPKLRGKADLGGHVLRLNLDTMIPGTVAHEFGHNLGFGHEFNGTRSILSYSRWRAVQSADVARIVRVYP